jgi:hypothetical protein
VVGLFVDDDDVEFSGCSFNGIGRGVQVGGIELS